MQALVGDASWFVDPGEEDAYREAGAAQVVTSERPLVDKRNHCLTTAWDQGLDCVMLDDDLTKLQMVPQVGQKAVLLPFSTALKLMTERLDDLGLKLCGAATTNNAYFMRTAVSTHLFVRAPFIMVRPCELLFDPVLRLKEDYDYTLQHWGRYGGAVRCNDILPTFRYQSGAGGAVDWRTPALEEEAIHYLLMKWPGQVRRNPKRKHEVLLVSPRRSVLR